MKPHILTHKQAQDMAQKNPAIHLQSDLDLYIDELFDIDFPAKKDTKTKEEVEAFGRDLTDEDPENWGSWVYYPWLEICLQIPPVEELRMLRTSRNRNLITAEEQQKLYSATIFIAGMSVGSNIVEALVSQGVGGKLILADMDIIEPSNLNRIRSPLHHVGLHKVEAISRKVWEIDPYIEIVALREGVTQEILDTILEQENVTVVIDEIDNLGMKVAIREKAKELSLPVIMAADDGDDSLIDVDRYDLHTDLEIFNGLIPKHVIARIKEGDLPRRELGMMIGKYFVGPEHTPLRMFQSVMEVGRSLPSWPQLGGAAALSGVALTYVTRKIILGEYVKEGRTLVSLNQKLSKTTDEEQAELQHYIQMMKEGGNG